MAGDDVDSKKPDPMIYRIAAERLNVDPKECLVVEDSTIGLQVTCHAALKCKARSICRLDRGHNSKSKDMSLHW